MFSEKDRNNTHQIISENIVKKSGVVDGGYGVFAGRDYDKDDLVEKCVFLVSEAPFGQQYIAFESHML